MDNLADKKSIASCTVSPPVDAANPRRWPLQWIVEALRVREADMPPVWGCDLTLHMRFLRASRRSFIDTADPVFYVLLQASVVLPVLMPLHVLYAPDNISKTSMIRASVSSLVESSGYRWLWVHSILIWWTSIMWILTVLWIVWGGIGYRKREVARLKARAPAPAIQFRTLMVLNIPPDMRDEETLRGYFDHYLSRYRSRAQPLISMPDAMKEVNKALIRPARMLARNSGSRDVSRVQSAVNLAEPPSGRASPDKRVSQDVARDDDVFCEKGTGDVDEVILVRKLGSLISLRDRRNKVLKELELVSVHSARLTQAHVKLARRVLSAVRRHKQSHKPHDRLDALTAELGQYVDDEPEQLGHSKETVWEVLHRLPRELLDPYQSLTHLPITSAFRKTNAPLIDYLTTKLAYLTLLLDEARSKPLEDFATSSAAFVTFRDARTARLALRVLNNHPKRSLACHTHPAPNWVEILWPRLGRSVYRSGFVRGWVVFLGVWAFTLAWVSRRLTRLTRSFLYLYFAPSHLSQTLPVSFLNCGVGSKLIQMLPTPSPRWLPSSWSLCSPLPFAPSYS